jgi:flavodoxin
MRTASATTTAEEVVENFKTFIAMLKDYFDTVVFTEEEEAEIYLLREEDDLDHLYDSLRALFDEIKQALPNSEGATNPIAKLLDKIYKEGIIFKQKLQKATYKIRDQRRESDHFRDKIFTLRKDFENRKAIKQLLDESAPKHKKKQEEERDIKNIEHHLKEIMRLKKGSVNDKTLHRIQALTQELAKDVTEDLALLTDILNNLSIIIDYAVYNFFRAMELEHICEKLLLHYKDNLGLWNITYNHIEQMFKKQLEEWSSLRERREWRIIKGARNKAKKEIQSFQQAA